MINIAICGKMGTGKTSLSNFINKYYFDSNAVVASFANFIKEIQKNPSIVIPFFLEKYNNLEEFDIFSETLEKLNSELKGGEKPRKQFQFIGDYFNNNFSKSFWIDKFFNDFKEYKKIIESLNLNINGLIIDDLRKLIEYNYLKENNFIIIGIEIDENERLNIIDKNKLCNLSNLNSLNHSSEIEVDYIINDLKFNNLNEYYEFKSNRRIIINKKIDYNLLKVIFDYFNSNYNERGLYEG